MCLFFKLRKIIVAHAVLHDNLANAVLILAKHRGGHAAAAAVNLHLDTMCVRFFFTTGCSSRLLTKEPSWVRPRFEWTCNQF